ncbi:MAG: MFS transporter [Ktedonobacteraceae bacterium]
MSTQTDQRPKDATPYTQQGDQQNNVASFRRVLKNRNFLLLWLAQLISLTVFNAVNFGVVLLVTDLTHSVFMVGLAIISFTLPAIPFGAVAGSIVDHLDKRLVLWVTNLLRMGTMVLIVVSLLTNRTSLWPLYLLSYLASLIGQFFIPAEGSSIPILVGEGDLLPALSLFNISITVSQALGFLLLGRVIATLFPPFSVFAIHVQPIDMLFVVSAILYIVCAILILLIPQRAFHDQHSDVHLGKGTHIDLRQTFLTLWHDTTAGWHTIRVDPLLFYAVIQLSVVGVIMLLIGELAGTFVQQVLHRPAADMSIILAPAAVGLIGASVLMPRIAKRVSTLRLATIGFIVLAVGFVALPSSEWVASLFDPRHGVESPLLIAAIVVIVLVLGAAIATVNIPTQTLMQEQAPEESRARVLAFQYTLYSVGSIPVLLFAGVFAQFVGFNQLIGLLAASLLLFCWWGVWYVQKHRQKE